MTAAATVLASRPAASTATDLLAVVNLGKRFPARDPRREAPWVIRNMSFTVKDGEFLTIVGPSGSGKTTLLNMIAQTDYLSEGEIYLRGARILDAGMRKLRPGSGCQIGYVTQEDNLLPWRTAIDNVLFPLRMQKRLNADTRARADELMAVAGLTGFEKYYPHELSGGMRKRLSLVRTLVYDPPVILMDEPFGALDAQTRTQLQGDLLRLCRMKTKTIVFITHDIAEAISLGHRTLVVSRAPAAVILEQVNDLPRGDSVEDLVVHPAFAPLFERIRAAVR
jgi:NitT/TauT family transport system ATP-binding protein